MIICNDRADLIERLCHRHNMGPSALSTKWGLPVTHSHNPIYPNRVQRLRDLVCPAGRGWDLLSQCEPPSACSYPEPPAPLPPPVPTLPPSSTQSNSFVTKLPTQKTRVLIYSGCSEPLFNSDATLKCHLCLSLGDGILANFKNFVFLS